MLVLGGLGLAFFAVPLIGLLTRVPWRDLPELLSGDVVTDALRISVIASVSATVISLVLGVPLAVLLARVDFPGRSLVRGVVTLPLVLPPVVAGVALVTALGRNGLIGSALRDATGLTVPYTTGAVVIAHTFVSMPFYVLALEGALRASGERYDVVAATLGADRWTTSAGSPSPWRSRAWSPDRCWRGPGRWASSAR